MSLFDDEAPPKKAIGGMSMLGNLKGKFVPTGTKQSDSSWKKIWDARGGFNFSLPKGTSCEIVLLEDVSIFVVAPMLTGWVEKENFPKLDYVRSLGFTDAGDPSGSPCVVSEVTGFNPTVVGVSVILDMRSFKDKNGVEHKYSIRPLLIKSESVLNQLQTISKHHQRSLAYARMTVSRAMDNKSPGSGDTWFCESFMDPAKIAAKIPGFAEEKAKINIQAAYPRPTLEEAKTLLKLHVAMCEKYKDKGNKVTNYNKEAWGRLTGGEAQAAPASPFAGLEDVEETHKTPVKEARGGFDLSELDDVLG